MISDNIISNGSIQSDCGESYDDGKLTRQRVTIFIDGIKTSSGSTFSIIFYTLNIYEENADLVGVSEIDIYKGVRENGSKIYYQIGEFIEI